MLRRMLILALIFVFAALGVWAQESNNPNLSEDANACAEGGAMEGKCNIDFNEDGEISKFEVDWAWACGWYLIRYDAGIFAEVPSWCMSLVPPELPDDIVSETEEPGGGVTFCYAEVDTNVYYIYNTGGDGVVHDEDLPHTETDEGETPPDLPVCVFDGK